MTLCSKLSQKWGVGTHLRVGAYIHRETFSVVMSHSAMSLGLRSCVSRKGGTGLGGGGWMHPKGANSMAVSGLHGRKDLIGTRMAISVAYGICGLRNKSSCIVEPPFPAFMAHFSGWDS